MELTLTSLRILLQSSDCEAVEVDLSLTSSLVPLVSFKLVKAIEREANGIQAHYVVKCTKKGKQISKRIFKKFQRLVQ